jgi:RNA polymerase sigma-70 factor (ECF subfamily)
LSPQTIDDAALVTAAKAGDRSAFARLYERYARLIHGMLIARVHPDSADDLLQDVFLQALRGIRGLRASDSFGQWICAIARNTAVSHYRSARQHSELSDAVSTRDDSEAIEAFEVLRHIQALPEAYRETLALRLVEGMTGAEIAERTGLKHGSVRVNLHRGMELLRERLRIAATGGAHE